MNKEWKGKILNLSHYCYNKIWYYSSRESSKDDCIMIIKQYSTIHEIQWDDITLCSTSKYDVKQYDII